MAPPPLRRRSSTRTNYGQVSGGLNELGTQGAFETGRFTPDATEDQSMLAFKLYYGRFISDRIFHVGDTSRRVVAYVQGSAGQYFSGDGDVKPLYYAAGPGCKWFLGEGGALNVSALFRHQRFPEEIRNSAFTGYNDIVVTVGAAIYFGR